MNSIKHFILIKIVLLWASYYAISQVIPSDDSAKPLITASMLDRLDAKTAFLNENIEKQTTRYLLKMARQEEQLKKKLMKLDSSAAKKLFNGAEQKYVALENKMKNIGSADPGSLKGDYLPYIDSIKGALKFLDKNKDLLPTGSIISDKLNDINQLQNSLNQATEVTAFLKERKKQIGEALKKYTKLPKGISKGYSDISKSTYYYGAQIQEYKQLLKDKSKIEQKVLEVLNKVPAFSSFMRKHSLLAGLFRIPANYGTTEALAGLQTRDQVQQLVGTRIGGSGPNAQALLQQNLQAAQTQLSQIKDKINQLGGGSGDMDMPDFTPQKVKTKTFLQRLEYGTNLQSQGGSYLLPSRSELGLTAGYIISNRSTAGIGMSYFWGWGRPLKHIKITHESIGLRSFWDWKVKGSLFISGGYERVFNASFKRIEELRELDQWQDRGLIGLTKKFQISKKVKGNAQVLYDVLWKQQIPRTQPIVFRIGYGLNK